jgi:hypothetical protein
MVVRFARSAQALPRGSLGAVCVRLLTT